MSELIDSSAASEIDRLTLDDAIATYEETAGIAFLESGCDMDIVARLQTTLRFLESRVGCSFKTDVADPPPSPSLLDILESRTTTIQGKVAASTAGQNLILLVTALASAIPSLSVCGILREVVAMSFGVTRVADLSDSYVRELFHAPTAWAIRAHVAKALDKLMPVFERGETGGHRRASERDMAALLVAFGHAQHLNKPFFAPEWSGHSPRSAESAATPRFRVCVNNLVGMEGICAALSAGFDAKVTIRQEQFSFVKPWRALLLKGERLREMERGIPRTTIEFKYDGGDASVEVVDDGSTLAVTRHLVPWRSRLPPKPPTVTARHLRSSACERLKGLVVDIGSLAAAAAYYGRAVADDLAFRLKEDTPTHLDRLAIRWVALMEYSLTEGQKPPSYPMKDDWEGILLHEDVGQMVEPDLWSALHSKPFELDLKELLPAAGAFKTDPRQYLSVLAAQHGETFALKVERLFRDSIVQESLRELWVATFFRALCAGQSHMLELSTRAVENFALPTNVESMIEESANVIPAYSRIDARFGDCWSRLCSIVQSGPCVILPLILIAEGERHCDPGELIAVYPGSLAFEGWQVDGFYPDPDTSLSHDADYSFDDPASRTLEYGYDIEGECLYRLYADGRPLCPVSALKAFLRMDPYLPEAEVAELAAEKPSASKSPEAELLTAESSVAPGKRPAHETNPEAKSSSGDLPTLDVPPKTVLGTEGPGPTRGPSSLPTKRGEAQERSASHAGESVGQ